MENKATSKKVNLVTVLSERDSTLYGRLLKSIHKDTLRLTGRPVAYYGVANALDDADSDIIREVQVGTLESVARTLHQMQCSTVLEQDPILLFNRLVERVEFEPVYRDGKYYLRPGVYLSTQDREGCLQVFREHHKARPVSRSSPTLFLDAAVGKECDNYVLGLMYLSHMMEAVGPVDTHRDVFAPQYIPYIEEFMRDAFGYTYEPVEGARTVFDHIIPAGLAEYTDDAMATITQPDLDNADHAKIYMHTDWIWARNNKGDRFSIEFEPYLVTDVRRYGYIRESEYYEQLWKRLSFVLLVKLGIPNFKCGTSWNPMLKMLAKFH